jgi:hypothetical protein
MEQSKDMFEWKFQFTEFAEIHSDETVQRISEVFEDGFGLSSGWDVNNIRKAYLRSTIVGLLEGANGDIAGYAFYSAPAARLNGSHLLWEDAVCIKKGLQGRRLSSGLLFAKASSMFPDRTFGWIGGRTQNPLVIRRYQRLGRIFPFDQLYNEDDGRFVMDFLISNIIEVGEVTANLDHRTGVCRRVYSEGRLGDYGTSVTGAERFEEQLARWGFDRERGDAAVVVVELRQPIRTY